MTQIDEFDNDKFINMNFVEFLDAIVRVAENMQLPHIIDDADILETEILPDGKSWGSRALPYKLESLILILCKTNLGAKTFEKYIKEWQEYKDSGLYANNIDAGQLKLQ